jgi:hypothetical protein
MGSQSRNGNNKAGGSPGPGAYNADEKVFIKILLIEIWAKICYGCQNKECLQLFK